MFMCSPCGVGMERWIGRVAFVTGASSGIGAEICKTLMKHGLNVIGCARDSNKIQKLVEDKDVATFPGRLHAMRCDLSHEGQILSMFGDIERQFGRLDICINNAGFNRRESNLLSGQTEHWRLMFQVNALALCICTSEAIKLMEKAKQEEGHIINISSLCDRKIPADAPDTHFYAGTKAMVRAVSEGLRNEVKSLNTKIGVSVISPGLVKTGFVERCWGHEMANNVYNNFNFLTPADIAAAVVHIMGSPGTEVDMNIQAVERKTPKQ